MKLLVACERSGVVRRDFRALGIDAWSADLQPADDGSPYHIQGDVLNVLDRGWDMMIGHPPCTFLTNSGVQWLWYPIKVKYADRGEPKWQEDRAEKMRWGADFFMALWKAPIDFICLENPIMHKYAKQYAHIPKEAQIIQPFDFGDDASKQTCLWLKNLPLLQNTEYLPPRHPMIYKGETVMRYANQSPSGASNIGPSETRQAERSETFPGVAEAMADQWGNLVLELLGETPKHNPYLLY